jgi:hypothetical protein
MSGGEPFDLRRERGPFQHSRQGILSVRVRWRTYARRLRLQHHPDSDHRITELRWLSHRTQTRSWFSGDWEVRAGMRAVDNFCYSPTHGRHLSLSDAG